MTRAISVLACVALWGAACGERGSSASAGEPDQVYLVRGVLEGLPDRDGTIVVHHEAIPEFVNRQGKRNGMPSMSMPFGVAKQVSLTGFAVGDTIEFTLEVRWGAPQVLLIRRLKKLPADR